MDLKEDFKLGWNVHLVLKNKHGKVKDERKVHNLVTTAGKTYIAAWLAAASQAGAFMSYIGIGAGAVAAAIGDTALGSELSRKAGTISSSTNVWANTYTFLAGDGTGAVTEAGLLSAAAAGTLFARVVFGVITKEAGDTLQVSWTLALG